VATGRAGAGLAGGEVDVEAGVDRRVTGLVAAADAVDCDTAGASVIATVAALAGVAAATGVGERSLFDGGTFGDGTAASAADCALA